MEFFWIDGYGTKDEEVNGISKYECRMYDENGVMLQEICFFDFSTKFEVEFAQKHHVRHLYAYEVEYCNGYSMSKGFDRDPDGYHHFGWQGVKEHTVDDIKRWCENYLASMYIIDYEKELKELEAKKRRSDWLIEHGYQKMEVK